jgi:hypothetical protein
MRVSQPNRKGRRLNAVLWLVVFMGLPRQVNAQSWSGILDPSRAIDWSQMGVEGGIPSGSWSQCVNSACAAVTSAGTSATTAQIQAAINSAPNNTYVLLGPGTYNIGALKISRSNVVLRGSGANQTILNFVSGSSGYVGCQPYFANICISADVTSWGNSTNNQPGGAQAATWSGGYSQGTTQITLTKVGSGGLINGQYIYLDQADLTSPVGQSALFVCGTYTSTPSTTCMAENSTANGRIINGVSYSQVQIVQVTAGCATRCTGAGPFTLTITPGVRGLNWSSSQTPGAWWPLATVQYAGVENVTINGDVSIGTNGATIGVMNAANCWLTGSAFLNNPRAATWFFMGAHNELRNNYFYGTQTKSSEGYGTELDYQSDSLIVNNIMQQVVAPFVGGNQFGNAYAYNFTINDYQTAAATCMYGNNIAHDAGANYNLWEGNVTNSAIGDDVHGSSGANTVFRNMVTGWELGKSCQTIGIWWQPYNRDENVVGNVIGTPGETIHYVDGANEEFSVYGLGFGLGEVPGDPVNAQTLLRWGNYDNVTGAVRWCGNSSDTGWSTTCSSTSEVPTGQPSYSNPVPSYGDTGAGQSPMTASFIYSSTPSWWPSGKPWPIIGPDVTGGNVGQCTGGTYTNVFATASSQCTGTGGAFTAHVNGGHAYSNPAMDCYFSMGGPPDGSGSALSFNESNCYSPNSVSPPTSSVTPPANLRAVVQ